MKIITQEISSPILIDKKIKIFVKRLDLINFTEPVFSIFPLDVITLSILTNAEKIILIPIKEQLEIRRY